MQHIVTHHWELAGAIGRASDGDAIICNSLDQAELGERTRQRVCPTKRLSFAVGNNVHINRDDERTKT